MKGTWESPCERKHPYRHRPSSLIGIENAESHQSGSFPPDSNPPWQRASWLFLCHLITGTVARPRGKHSGTQSHPGSYLYACQSKLLSRFFHRYQQLTPPNTAASTQPDSTLWKNLLTAIGEVATAQKSTISLRAVSGLNSIPTGFCIRHSPQNPPGGDSSTSPVSRWKPGGNVCLPYPNRRTSQQ